MDVECLRQEWIMALAPCSCLPANPKGGHGAILVCHVIGFGMMKNFLRIIFEDTDILVIDKPAGLVVEKNMSVRSNGPSTSIMDVEGPYYTLEDILLNDFKIHLPRGGIVHRLDKDTSGVMVIAKNKKALVGLQNQFQSRGVEKEYRALIYGNIKPEKGSITIALKRDTRNRTRFIPSRAKDAREAVTDYAVVSPTSEVGEKGYSYVAAYPETGRTHQIRAHFYAIGHPILGDQVYATEESKTLSQKLGITRQALHAYRLSFTHPITGKKVSFEAPLPGEMGYEA